LTFFFFYDSPFIGNLIPTRMQNSLAALVFKYFYSFGLVPFLTIRINVDALTVAGYHFILGPIAFTEYIESILGKRCGLSRNFNTTVKTYNEVSILANEFNGIFCFRMFVKVLFPGFIVPIICVFTMVSLHNTLNASMTLVLTVLATLVFSTFEFLLTLCACLWSKSAKFMENFGAMEHCKVNHAYKKKLMKSLMLIRIKLGESNFVEKCTPLVVLSLCFEQTATLLCLRRRN